MEFCARNNFLSLERRWPAALYSTPRRALHPQVEVTLSNGARAALGDQ
jgi:hypothetical protein